MRRAFTLIELLISISLIAIIAATISALSITSIRNYQTQTEKSRLQRELNFVLDDMATQMKFAQEALLTLDGHTRDQNPDDVLILDLPAQDLAQNFIYDGAVIASDYLIYYKDGENLKRKTISNLSGRKSHQNNQNIMLVSDVSLFLCTYIPNPQARQVKCVLEINKIVSGQTIKSSGERIVNLRNKR